MSKNAIGSAARIGGYGVMNEYKGTLLVIHTAYPFAVISERKMAEFLTMRDESQYFERVIHLNPVASIQNEVNNVIETGKSTVNLLDSRNMVVDGCVNRFNLKRFFLSINLLSAIVSQYRLVVKLSHDCPITLIRAEDPSFSGLLGLIFAKILKVKFIVVIRGNHIEMRRNTNRAVFPRIFRFRKIEHRVEKFVVKHAAHTIFQNYENAKYAQEMSLSIDKYSIQSIASGISRIHIGEPRTRSEQPPSINDFKVENYLKLITIARLEEVKLIEDVIEVAAILMERQVMFNWCIVGEGNLRTELNHRISQLNLEKNIILVGEKPQEWIAKELRISDVGVVLLAGRALVEMGLAGIAIAAYDTDWHAEFIRDGENGILVPFRSIDQLASVITALSTNPKLRLSLGMKIRADSLNFIARSEQSNAQYDLYKELTQ